MEIKRFDGTGRMSGGVIHNGTLYLCGQTDRTGTTVKEQTQNILDNLELVLEKYGSGADSILSATIYLKDMSTFDEMNSVWDAWVKKGFEPARACVEAKLAWPDMLVELSIIAAVK